MKQQEMIEKVLRQKLEGAEMEPPAAMFDRIAAQIDRPVVLAWYRRPAILKAAAAFALMAVSAGVLLNNLPTTEKGMGTSSGLASYDSLQRERLDGQLESLKLAAAQAMPAKKEASENKKSNRVQPVNQALRLANETQSNQSMEQTVANRVEVPGAMETKGVIALRSSKPKLQQPQKVQVPAFDQNYASAEESGILPTLSKSYSVLSNGGLFDLAKERFDEFKTKEHYVSFNLGSLEIGQTIQLSRPQNDEIQENK